eukprot:TRINITY_DN125152_c0_g1_i1.p1 TRINITY_DN125152_c0_g1~~TRINITY_DN125152_c0_g1_i1.p1  ORF type:complete len:467 (-),score=6.80 TRINITY_DN125152_c0_g1_i1:311-1684(-)
MQVFQIAFKTLQSSIIRIANANHQYIYLSDFIRINLSESISSDKSFTKQGLQQIIDIIGNKTLRVQIRMQCNSSFIEFNYMEAPVSMDNTYAKHASLQRLWAKVVEDYLLAHPNLFQSTIRNTSEFCILDLGCADGCNAVELLTTAVTQARKLAPDKKIKIFLDDTPTTDVSKAVKTVKERLQLFTGLDAIPIPKSFYYQLLETPVIDFAYATGSTHWLSEVPAPLNTILYVSTKKTRAEPGGDKWEKIAEAHLAKFLDCRASEMKKGAHLIVCTLGVSDEVTKNERGYMRLNEKLTQGMLRSLSKYGLEEYADYIRTLPIYVGQKSVMEGFYRSSKSFTLLEFGVKALGYPPGLSYEEVKGGDRELCIGHTKGWSSGFIRGTLSSKGVDGKKIEDFMNDFYEVQVPEAYKATNEEPEGMFNTLTVYFAHLERLQEQPLISLISLFHCKHFRGYEQY